MSTVVRVGEDQVDKKVEIRREKVEIRDEKVESRRVKEPFVVEEGEKNKVENFK